MVHLPALIYDLAIILATAGVVTLIFKKIKQPVVLGYLLAGVLVGPEIKILPTIQDREAVEIWAEIGVIVLLFGLGLEFSFKKLFAIGKSASITAMTEIVTMFGAGYIFGQVLGWNVMDSIFLGGILSISSTTIIIRAFEEFGFKKKKFVSLVFGVLIVEDLVAILLLVLLSTIAVSNTFEGTQLLFSTARLIFFLTIWFVAGISIVPWVIKKIRPLMNQESSLIVSLALCLFMVVLATQLGFSPALGAFVMGSLLAETPDSESIEHTLQPVKDLFSAIFFVSVGMLINLDAIANYWGAILIISAVTIVGKIVSTSLGSLLSGQSLKHSISAGMSLAQIGEFSFIIATLGLTLGVISDFIYPIAVAVSAITTFTTPYLIRASEPTYEWIEKRVPAKWKPYLEKDLPEHVGKEQSRTIQKDLVRLFVNSTIIIAIALASSKWLFPWVEKLFTRSDWVTYIALMITIVLCLPFLWAIVFRPKSLQYKPLSMDDFGQFTSRAVFALIGRTFLAVFLIGFIVKQFTSALMGFILVIALITLTTLFGFKNFNWIYQWMENHFLKGLHGKEIENLKRKKAKPVLAPWDAHLADLEVHPNSNVVGKSLASLALRKSIGVSVAMIERGYEKVFAPAGQFELMPYDKIWVIGTDEQLDAFSSMLGSNQSKIDNTTSKNYGLTCIALDENNSLIGKRISESRVRELAEGLIVGVEREHQRYLNPEPNFILQLNDQIWIAGHKEKIISLFS